MMVVLHGDAPLVAEEVEIAIGGADRNLELAGEVGGPERLPAPQPLERPEKAPQRRPGGERPDRLGGRASSRGRGMVLNATPSRVKSARVSRAQGESARATLPSGVRVSAVETQTAGVRGLR
jgi:hypothetical protein